MKTFFRMFTIALVLMGSPIKADPPLPTCCKSQTADLTTLDGLRMLIKLFIGV